MWIIKLTDRFQKYVGQVDENGWEETSNRADAHKFSRQEAKDFIVKFGIHGHVIPF